MTPSRLSNAIIALLLAIGIICLVSSCASQTQSQQAGQQVPDKAPQTVINAVTAADTADTTEVVVFADRPLTFSSLKQPDPLAVILYLPESTVQQLPAEQFVSSGLIKQVLARDSASSGTARIEIQLAENASYVAVPDGNTIKVTFVKNETPLHSETPSSKPSQTAGRSDSTASQEPSAGAANTSAGSGSYKEVSANKSPKSINDGDIAWVNKIDFLSEAEGKSTLVIGTTQAVDYRLDKNVPKKLTIHLLNTRIPSYRQRPLITTRFTSAVDRVVPYQPAKDKNESIISIEMREPVGYFVENVDNMLLVHFEASSVPPKPMEQAQLPAWKQAMSADSTSGTTMPEAGTDIQAQQTLAADASLLNQAEMQDASSEYEKKMLREDLEIREITNQSRKNYTGEKIALDFYDTDIKNVFRILREISGKNFAIDKDVTGKVTMTLDKPVPWDQVLDLVLRMNQLGMAKEGDIIRIATLESLKQEDDLRKAKLTALRQAKEEAKALEPLVTKYFAVSYSDADKDVKPHLEKILTSGRGTITVDMKNNQIILTDTFAKIKQAEEVIRRIDKVTAQVIIEARIVEVNINFSRELGITWNMSFGPQVVGGIGGNANTDMAMNFPSASTSSIGVNFSRLSGVPFVLNARLNALESTGEGRILSSPKILTLDNKKAKIKQGVEYPYLERDSSGGSSVKFKQIDLLLEVTPHVTPDNRISLIIFITKNDVLGITAGVPTVGTNEAETELLINDGDTVVIGGIIKKSESMGENGFPLLSKIPILGWLFKNKTDKTAGNELLIFMTPRIVQLEKAAAQSMTQ